MVDQDEPEEIISTILKNSLGGLKSLEARFEKEVLEAAEFIHHRNPMNFILLGSGKSGYIASRVAATLRSLGFNAFFLHSGELLHGDLGALKGSTLLIIFSNSGQTMELVKTAELARSRKIPIVSLIGHPNSLIGSLSNRVIDLSASRKYDFLSYVPTATLTVASVAGDCLIGALSQMHFRGITEFLENHPEGSLGKFLNAKVSSFMKPVHQVALLQPQNSLQEVARELTKFPNGIGVAITEGFRLIGIITDGDIRRLISENSSDNPKEIVIDAFINRKPTVIQPDSSVAQALKAMTTNHPKRISALPVVDKDIFIGVITMNDIEQRRDEHA